MNLEEYNQFLQILNSADRIAILFRNDIAGDYLCAGLALGRALKSKGKEIYFISRDTINHRFSFVTNNTHFQKQLSEEEHLLVIRAIGACGKLNEFWYDEKDRDVEIYIRPHLGEIIKEKDLILSVKGGPVAAIAIGFLDFPEQEHFTSPDILPSLSLINIDYKANNKKYGKVNIIDPAATTATEIIFLALKKLKLNIDPQTATIILTGLISKTDSFQNHNTTPRIFFTASELIELGADQQEIIKHLYKTKSFSHLKLWGFALANLRSYPEHGLISTILRQSEFEQAKASENGTLLVMRELMATLSDARIILFLAERKLADIIGFLHVKNPQILQSLQKELGAKKINDTILSFDLYGTKIEAAQEQMIKKLII